jgi:hypothetical protein
VRSIAALLVVLLATATSSSSRATPTGADVRVGEIDRLLKSGRRLKAAGQVLVGLGCVDAILATIIGPVGVYAPAAPGDTPPGMVPRGSDTPTLEAAAIGLAIAGAALITVGIPLMAEGDGRLERAHKLVGRTSIRVAASGVQLVW